MTEPRCDKDNKTICEGLGCDVCCTICDAYMTCTLDGKRSDESVTTPKKENARNIEEDYRKVRSALIGIVGAETTEELTNMETMLNLMHIPDKEKIGMLQAIQALKDTSEGVQHAGR